MPMVPWISPTYQHRSRDVSSKRTLNLYPETTDGQGKTQTILMGTPGTIAFDDLTGVAQGGCDGLYTASNGRVFGAFGGKIWEFSDGSGTYLRYNMGSFLEVTFADDGNILAFTDGAKLRYLNFSTNIVSEMGSVVSNPTQVIYFGQRFVAVNGSGQFWWSEISDHTNWPALNVASAESNPDDIVRIAVVQGQLWIFGSRSYEVRNLTSDPDFPYAYSGGSASEYGCGANKSAATIGDVVFWIGASGSGAGQVFASQGYSAVRISDHALEYQLSLTSYADAIGFCYQMEGHLFYCLSNVDSGKTWVYDLTEKSWHERSTANSVTYAEEIWCAKYACSAFGKVLVGHANLPFLMYLDLGAYSEWDGRYIVRIHQSPTYWDDLRMLLHREFKVDFASGSGLSVGQGSDPQAMLRWSDDGGNTWSNELWESFGAIGEYSWQVAWRNLGRSRERVYRLTISNPVKVVIMDARLIADKSVSR